MAVAAPVFPDDVMLVLRAFKHSLEAAVAAEVSTPRFPLLVMCGRGGSGKTVYRQALMLALAVRVYCVLQKNNEY
jgi:type II secretory pathway predicted ATPase ExeA